MTDPVRDPAGQALVSDGAATHLHPSGFDPSRIASELTDAQRETILFAWSYPDYHRNGPQVSYCPVWRNDSSRRALERKGLIASQALGGPRLTLLGMAVRSAIAMEAASAGETAGLDPKGDSAGLKGIAHD